MARINTHTVRYLGQEAEIEYEIEPGSDNFNSPGHICDGGGDPTIVMIISVKSDLGIMLYTQRQAEMWEEQIAMDFDSNPSFDDYDDNYM